MDSKLTIYSKRFLAKGPRGAVVEKVDILGEEEVDNVEESFHVRK